jgi:nicotinamide riboside kinase
MTRSGNVIAIVGAESTGKSMLAVALAARVVEATGLRCVAVGEVLRDWCDREGRTPRLDEQQAIAAEQQRRIASAAAQHEVVVADTTALMTAVYSRLVFADRSLDAFAVAAQRDAALTLLTALDLPWTADGLQRDGAHVREPVDRMVRALLAEHGLPWSVVTGQGTARLDSAFDAVTPLLAALAPAHAGLFTRLREREAAQPAWRWVCETCDLPDCEHALLRSLQGR